ncbi:MAG: hypothetical protein DDT22_01214 [candidate division WS2 bacterium]|nr:hypothetical protein [Candidatus Lithacetigena glycinireducens]
MLFKQDEERILTHGKSSRSGALLKFLSGGETVALIPGRVYEHWSGKKSHTLESASFSITLWHRIAPFSLNLAELFSTHFIIKEE